MNLIPYTSVISDCSHLGQGKAGRMSSLAIESRGTGLYVHATWLSKSMAGEMSCLYPFWFKAHFKVPPKRNRNLDAWNADHSIMVNICVDEYRSAGYEVWVEPQNDLSVIGKGGAKLHGRADIIAVRDDTAIIVDCKTGVPKASDTLQLRLYMFLLHHSKTHPARHCTRILGEVRYKPETGRPIELPHAAWDGLFDQMKYYLDIILAPQPPIALPSANDCRFCDLAKVVCDDSIDEPPPPSEVDWM